MCYNNKPFNLHYYNKPEDQISPEDLETIYENTDELEQHFTISGLKPGLYCIKHGIFNEQNSILNRWNSIGCRDIIDFNDIEFLKNTLHFDVFIEQVRVTDDKLFFSVRIPAHEFTLLNIYPVHLEE